MGRAMGLGNLGGSQLLFKRKFRWTLEIYGFCNGQGYIPESYVKLASRPNLTIEETEINFLNGKDFIPGKHTWETINVTYYDVATIENMPLFDWLATLVDFTDPVNLHQASRRDNYSGTAVLNMFSGCGDLLETWTLGNVWPQSVNFGDLDHASSEECTIELTLRYSNVQYQSHCPARQPEPCCDPCTGQSGNFAGTSIAGNFGRPGNPNGGIGNNIV